MGGVPELQDAAAHRPSGWSSAGGPSPKACRSEELNPRSVTRLLPRVTHPVTGSAAYVTPASPTCLIASPARIITRRPLWVNTLRNPWKRRDAARDPASNPTTQPPHCPGWPAGEASDRRLTNMWPVAYAASCCVPGRQVIKWKLEPSLRDSRLRRQPTSTTPAFFLLYIRKCSA